MPMGLVCAGSAQLTVLHVEVADAACCCIGLGGCGCINGCSCSCFGVLAVGLVVVVVFVGGGVQGVPAGPIQTVSAPAPHQ